jgi:hypothetical protein
MLLLTEGTLKSLLQMKTLQEQIKLECGQWNLITLGTGERKINI